MYIQNNSYANFKFELIDTLSRVNLNEFDYSKNYNDYSKVFREVVKDKCNALNEINIDRLKASVADVRPDLRFKIYSKLVTFNIEEFHDMLYWIYLDNMFNIVMWRRVIMWRNLTKNWW